MIGRVCKNFIIFLIVVLLSVAAALTVFAEEKNYEIDSVWWEEAAEGRLNARWEKPQNTTKYMVRLLKGTADRPAGNWHSCVATGYCMNKDIISNGSGSYKFEVYPVKLGEAFSVRSDSFEVDYFMLKRLKGYSSSSTTKKSSSSPKSNVEPALAPLGPGASKNETGADRWLKVKNDDWVRQKADGSLYKNQWLDIDGNRYWFDSNGIMQKNGWRSSGNIWYYLGNDGTMLKNTTTPDGFTVDAEGQCVINGEVYKSYLGPYLISKTTGDPNKASLIPVSLVTIKAGEFLSEAGKPKNIELSTSRNVEIVGEEYSIPYESWNVGRSITVTVRIAPVSGYYLKKGLKISPSSNLTLTSSSGNEQQYTFKFSYIPKVDLTTPDGFYITGEGVLNWNKVNFAQKYTVRVHPEDSTAESFETRKPQYDLSEYLGSGAEVTVTACGNTKNRAITNSRPFIIEDLDIFAEENTVEGTLGQSGNKLTYRNQDGEKADGWQQILGSWYHFTKGKSDGPGWYQDKTDGNWYYFDQEFRMVTGKINDNGKEYILNNGTYSGLPLGALVQ